MMMKGKILVAGSLVVALAACNKSGQQNAANGGNSAAGTSAPAAIASGATTVQPGLWEVSYEANVTGANLPPAYAAAMKGHKDTKRDCITPEEAAQPVNMMKDKDAACDYSGFSFGNGRIQGTITCGDKGKGGGKTSMTMNGQYDAQNYAYTSTMSSNAGGMNMTVETKAIGHRIGECPAGGAG
jgi:hypothetical protein